MVAAFTSAVLSLLVYIRNGTLRMEEVYGGDRRGELFRRIWGFLARQQPFTADHGMA